MTCTITGKWFEPRSLSRFCHLIVRVRVVPRRTVVQVAETLGNVTNNSPSQDYSHPDDHVLLLFSGECKTISGNDWQTE